MALIPAIPPAVAPIIAALLAILLAMGVVGVGAIVGAWKLVTAIGRKVLPRPAPPPPALEAPNLSRYPERLQALQEQLERSLQAGQSQVIRLNTKRDELAAKPGREAIAQRYQQDIALLEGQAEATHRVLATVWKTRAVLALRVHLAESTRARPELDHLPQPMEVSADQLDEAARAYTRACREVRGFVHQLDRDRGELHHAVPVPSIHAEVLPEHRQEVEREAQGIQNIFADLRERMDTLADTLDYLSDRFRTQQVVEGGSGALDLGPEAGQLLQEVSVAIRALDELSAVGDSGLADVAVDGLASEIASLEQIGLDVDLQADADREVERLLASLTRTEPPRAT